MIDLNNLAEIKKLDPKNVLGSVNSFINQCYQIRQTVENTAFEISTFKNVENIIFCGMGGSAYGGVTAQHLFKNDLKIPTYINSDYDLPKFAGPNSLVFLTSYSGNTEETLNCLNQAISKRAKILGLTSGGKLSKELTSAQIPAVVFDTKYNPSNQPRLGTGYVILGTIEILRKIGLVYVPTQTITDMITLLEQNHLKIQDQARDMAIKLHNKIPLIISGEFLAGNAHILRNQFNETAKSFASYHILPELNHHLMEGLKNPTDNKLCVLIINSNLYPKIIQKRIKLTIEVLEKNHLEILYHTPTSNNQLSQVFETLMFGGYLTFYLAILYNQDPSLIPWVDYFKQKMNS